MKSLGYWGLMDLCIRSMGIRQRFGWPIGSAMTELPIETAMTLW